MKKLTATVIIPAFNAQDTIDFCLEALIKQTGLDFKLEILVVDDGSTDETVEHIKLFQKQISPENISFKLLLQEKNQGPAAARNRGAEEATGEVLLFTDADCIPGLDWVREMLVPFQSEDVSAVKGAYRTQQPELVARFAQAEFESRYQLLEKKDKIDVVFTYAAAIKKAVFLKVGGFDTSFPKADNEDTELSYKIAENHTIIFNPRAIVYHRHPASLKEYLLKKFSRGYWRMYVYRSFPEKAVQDSYTPQSLKLQIALAYLLLLSLVLALFIPSLKYLVGLIVAIFIFTVIPFVSQVKSRSLDLLFAAPLFILLRAFVMGAGIISAIPMFFGHGLRAE
jgi:glycosyltransferase involved in cell wall biosynthesis